MRRVIAVASTVLASTAAATTMLAQDIEALSRGADAVVQGTVTKVESRWTADKLRIVTVVELEVSEALKGAPGRTATLIQPGGVVGDVGQKVSGLASFAPGEEVVVFLERRGGGTFHVAGMAQGKFRVERSSDGQATFAIPEHVDAVLLDPITREPVEPSARAMRLEELKQRVRAALGQAPAAPAPSGPGKKVQ